MVSSYGTYLAFASTIFFCIMAIYTLFAGRRVTGDYWETGGTTLEWTVSSPPPFHQFETLPRVK
jgi:cytochrome c oxidase subunit 1